MNVLFLKLIYYEAGTVVDLLLLKGFMPKLLSLRKLIDFDPWPKIGATKNRPKIIATSF